MCGRFTRHLPWSEIHRLYRLIAPNEGPGRNTPARYNIAPTQTVDFITWNDDGTHKLREGRWWLVPAWAKEVPKYAMFNARSEDAEVKPAFRDSFRAKRCLIPADGFYEWTKGEDGGKDPWHIFLPGHQPFSFAGLWAYNPALDITSCTILTAAATEPMAKLHTRQPIILDPAVYDAWLDPATPVADAKTLLKFHLDGDLAFYRVSRAVNATKGSVEGPELIESIE